MADYNFTADHAENNMACDVSITFVDELRDFDVEKSGKNKRRRAKWSWFAAIAEESGSDVDPTEIAAEPGSQSNSSASESEAVESEDESIEEESSEETISSENSTEESDESDERLEKPKGDRRSSNATSRSSKNKSSQAKSQPPKGKPRNRKTKETNSLTQDELEDLCFELGESKDDLLNFAKEKLQTTGDINFFASRSSLRSIVIEKLPELLDELSEVFIETMRDTFAKKISKAEKKATLSHCWSQKLPTFLQNEVWCSIINGGDVSRGDQISVLSCIAEAVFDFAHTFSRSKTLSKNSASAETQLAEEELIILHRFGGAAIYRMAKVRKNTIDGRKGTMKVTAARRDNLQKELEIVQKMRRESLTNLPRELVVHLNEGGLHFMKDELLDFVRLADNCTRKFTNDRIFGRNPSSFLNTVFSNVYGNDELFTSFVNSLKSVGVVNTEEGIVKSVYRELLTKLCRTRVKSFLQNIKEKDLEVNKKVCDVDTSLRDKLKGYVMNSKR